MRTKHQSHVAVCINHLHFQVTINLLGLKKKCYCRDAILSPARCKSPANSPSQKWTIVLYIDLRSISMRKSMASAVHAHQRKQIHHHTSPTRNGDKRIFFNPKILFLGWERLDELKTSYIKYQISSSGLSDMKRWDELQNKMIDAMIRLERAFKSEIQNL